MIEKSANIPWDDWKCVRLIGRGSYGTVYEIERKLFKEDTDRETEKAALKVITIPQNESDIEEMYSDGYNEKSVSETFYMHMKSITEEYFLMRKMHGSANIVNCDDVKYTPRSDGIGWNIYIRMELLTPLTKVLPMVVPEEQVIRIAKDLCAALVLCKKHNIIHRDIKPQNIFVSGNGDYKLGDFGIAKTVEKTMGGTKTGTYKYMAPEVYNNQPYNSTADIYSLGLVLYWMLNERRMPFMPLPPVTPKHGDEEKARQRRFSGDAIPAPRHGSDALKAIVMKACAYNPNDRYQSAKDMLDDLLQISHGYAGAPQPESTSIAVLDDDNSAGCLSDSSEKVDLNQDDEGTMGPVFDDKPDVDLVDEDTVGPNFDSVKETDTEKGERNQKSVDKGKKYSVIFAVLGACIASVLIYLFTAQRCLILGHNWSEATCITPKTCTVCSVTDGRANGHNLSLPTCTKPITCIECSATFGDPHGKHKWLSLDDYAECIECGEPNGVFDELSAHKLLSAQTDNRVIFYRKKDGSLYKTNSVVNGAMPVMKQDPVLDDCHRYSARIMELNEPIENCASVELALEVSDVVENNGWGEWGFYYRDLKGKWHLADTFIYLKDYSTYVFGFDGHVDFDAWAVARHGPSAGLQISARLIRAETFWVTVDPEYYS